jgi:hypothetical protein
MAFIFKANVMVKFFGENIFKIMKSGPEEATTLLLSLRTARFFMVQRTKTGKYIPNDHNIYQMSMKYSKWL